MLVGLLFVANIAGAACMGPFCWDDRGAYIHGRTTDGNGDSLVSFTAALSNTATPTNAGQIVYCSDCTISKVCVSSGTGRGAYVVASSTSTGPAALLHCQ